MGTDQGTPRYGLVLSGGTRFATLAVLLVWLARLGLWLYWWRLSRPDVYS